MDYIINIAAFGLQGYGLFLINKKLGEKYTWTAFIPFVHMYAVATAAGKNIKWLIVLLLSGLLAFFSVFGGVFLTFLGLDTTIMTSLASLSLIFIIVYVLIYLHFLDQISKRTGGGFFRALGFLIFPYIVFPIVGHKFKVKSTTPKEKEKKYDL